MVSFIGWASSVILLLTLGKQVHKQWRERSSRGVSRWLYFGEIGAGSGFVVYSVLIHSWVFVVTNALAALSGIAGAAIHLRNERLRSVRAGGEGRAEGAGDLE